MRMFMILLLALLAMAAIAFAMGLFDSEPTTDPTTPNTGPGASAATAGAQPLDAGPGLSGADASKVRPVEEAAFRKERSVLVVSTGPDSFTVFATQVIGNISALRYRTWFTDRTEPGATEGPAAQAGDGGGRGLAELNGPPDGNFLTSQAVDAVYIDRIDPNALPASFWDVLTKRVRSKETGVWIRMTNPPSPDGAGASVHALMTHPAVASLLPVRDPRPFEGEDLPGLYPSGTPLHITERGVTHPASRLVDHAISSRHWWQVNASGDHAWETAFAYPVGGVVSGAEVLLEIRDGLGKGAPALVAGAAEDGRVLWQAWDQFDRKLYFRSDSQARLGSWITQIVAWLTAETE